MKIGIVGNGVVGSAIARCYMGFVEKVRVYDHVPERETHWNHQVLECDLVFICLPETSLDDYFGFENLADGCRGVNFVIKSTVAIGTTRRLAQQYNLTNVYHSPEFLTERCSFVDAMCPAQQIIGLVDDEEKATWNAPQLRQLYQRRFPGIPIRVMKAEESEATKLITNAFFATKVAFFNEMNTLCDALRLDWDTVLAGVLGDGRIAHSHTQVPGHDGRYGFGGKCLPKDLEMLQEQFMALRRVKYPPLISPEVISATLRRNMFDRERQP